MSLEFCQGTVAGVTLRCSGESALLLAQLDRALLDRASTEPIIGYSADRDRRGAWRLREGDRLIAVTEHETNLFGLLREDLPRHVERRHPCGIWLHAASLLRADGACLLLAGRPGEGKSTAALNLASGGWRYMSDDRVLVDPATRNAIGVNWPIRLETALEDLSYLRRENFELFESRWTRADGSHVATLVCPPPAARAIPAGPHPLGMLLFLERGAPAITVVSAGAALVRLWPERIARVDGREPLTPALLAHVLAQVRCGVLSRRHAYEVPLLIQGFCGPK